MDRDGKRFRLPLFFIIFFSLLGIISVSGVTQYLLFTKGMNNSLYQWDRDREERLIENIRGFLLEDRELNIVDPVLITDSDKNIIYGSPFGNPRGAMGMGRGIPLKPIYDRSHIIGYYSIGVNNFRSIRENSNLLNNILDNLILTIVLSIVLSGVVSFFIAWGISRSTARILKALTNIRNLDDFTPSGPREFTSIGYGIKEMAQRVTSEESTRKQWIHDISHDLKTPVSALSLQFEGMLEGTLDISRERIEKNRVEISRLSDLIQGLNETMSIESDLYNLKIDNIPILDILKELKLRFSDLTGDRSIVIPESSSVVIKGDYNLIYRSLYNLMDNAIKYYFENSEITVDITENSLSIISCGDSIKDCRKIFQRLYREDFSRNRPGSGLGLSITKEILDKHGFTIKAESNSGKNIFTIGY